MKHSSTNTGIGCQAAASVPSCAEITRDDDWMTSTMTLESHPITVHGHFGTPHLTVSSGALTHARRGYTRVAAISVRVSTPSLSNRLWI